MHEWSDAPTVSGVLQAVDAPIALAWTAYFWMSTRAVFAIPLRLTHIYSSGLVGVGSA